MVEFFKRVSCVCVFEWRKYWQLNEAKMDESVYLNCIDIESRLIMKTTHKKNHTKSLVFGERI